jgi:transcriptional regulator with XRE-family HTH domain
MRGTVQWHVNTASIERARILRGWSREQLARAAKVDPKTLGDMMASRRRPTLSTVQSIGHALGMELSNIIDFD